MSRIPNVLIIDDDHNMRETIRVILEEEKLMVAEAKDGDAGIKYIKKYPVDLIIVDIIMPEKDGIEVIMEVSNNYPQIKILSLSGGGLIDAESHLISAIELGADDTLTKPFKNSDLTEKVKKLLYHEKSRLYN